MDNNEKTHITEYSTLAKVLIVLLTLTLITVAVTGIHLGALTVTIALLIACTKAYIVLNWFMHLKYEQPIFRYMVLGVLLLFVLIIVITFLDYALR